MTAAAGEAIRLPAWTPEAVVNAIKWIASRPLQPDHADVLTRLATDPRMRGVWRELARSNEDDSGFFHAARPPARARPRSVVDAQADALGETFHFVWCVASERKAVSKPGQVEAERERLLHRASVIREAAGHPAQAAEADALRRAADRYEAAAAKLRGADDPMMIKNNRGDPVVRGVQVLITAFLLERFGSRLDGTAAILAGVALGATTTPRAGRSAFSG